MVDKQAIEDSPSVEADQELSETEERRLFEHYGVPYATESSDHRAGCAGAGTAAGREPAASDAARARALRRERGRPRRLGRDDR